MLKDINKKMVGLFIVCLFVIAFSGCGKGEASNELHWMTNASESTFRVYEDLAREFEKESGIQVNVTTHGRDLEQLLKARIASDSLPDLFSTHGWSVARYSDFLLPLTDQQWFERVPESAKEILTDTSGDIFVLPLTIIKDGITVNLSILEEIGVDISDIKTMDDFKVVLKRAQDAGKTPIYVGGRDPRVLANTMDLLATGMFTTTEGNDYSKSLSDGSFDWDNWSVMSNLLLEFDKNGFFNKNALTADDDSYIRALAREESVFGLGRGSAIEEAQEYNSDLRLAIMPIPSYYEDGEPYFIGGERETIGISKNSKNSDDAIKFLEFMARSESIARVAAADQNYPAIEGVEVDFGLVGEYFEKFSDINIYPYFDREHLPGGMWSTLQIVGNGVLSGDVSVEAANKTMKEDYERLR